MKIKIISDAACTLFIDNEEVAIIQANELTIVPIEKGEYIIRYECLNHREVFIEKDLVVEYDKVERISFKDYLIAHIELLVSCQKRVAQGPNGLWGYVLSGTDLEVVPFVYDEAEEYRRIDGRTIAYVKKDGCATFIDGKGEPIIPIGEYVAMDYYKNLFIARDRDGNGLVLSDLGVKMFDMKKDKYAIANHSIYAYQNLIAKELYGSENRTFNAYFPSGELIESLGEFNEIKELFVPDVWGFTPSTPYYIISKNGLTGIVRVERYLKKASWITECKNTVEAHWERRSSDMGDPIAGVDLEFDTYGLVELSNPENNRYTCVYNYPEHNLLVVTERVINENGPDNHDRVTMYNSQGRVIFQQEDVDISVFSFGEANIRYNNGKKRLINTNGDVFDYCD